MKLRPALLALALLFTAAAPLRAQGLYPTDDAYRQAFLARCVEAREAMARKTWTPGYDSRVRNYLGIVKLATGIDAATGLKYLEDAVADPKPVWGCFEVYAFMEAVERLGDKLPPALVEKIRTRLAASFTDDFGFTDNHMLQIHVARYLFGQRWPDGPVFADGSTPAAAARDSAAWIRRWIDSSVNRGMFEYDSPNYHHLYLLCFASLHEFSKDELMRRQSWMMMQVLLAEWATEYLEGNWVGAHSREKYDQVLHTHEHTGAATRFGRLYFGAAPLRPDLKESEAVGLAALQEFPALPMLGRIATDRTQVHILRELKPPRRGPRIHYGEPTWKYTLLAPQYAVGSSWGDLTDVEQHRWDLTWLSPQDGSTVFFINPSISVKQLHRYFEDPVDKLLGAILRTRPYYTDPNKWIEPSPFEDVFQHDAAVIDLYDIPPTAERQHINGVFPHSIAEKREQDGWIFCRADGIYFGVWTSVPGEWHKEENYDRLTIVHPKTAVILEAAAAKDEKSFDDFCARLRAGRPQFNEKTLTGTYTNRQGRKLQFTHRGPRVVDGTAVNLDAWPLFEGPWLNARRGTGIITLQYSRERVTLDFNTATVRTEAVP
jgi:hypothetical protein